MGHNKEYLDTDANLYKIKQIPQMMRCKGKFCNNVVLETYEYCKVCGYEAGVLDVNGKPVTAKTKAKDKHSDFAK